MTKERPDPQRIAADYRAMAADHANRMPGGVLFEEETAVIRKRIGERYGVTLADVSAALVLDGMCK
jgi:hypothetical protein